jgi:hypothetical protein
MGRNLNQRSKAWQIWIVLIAIVPQRNQGIYETVEGIHEFEIFFLSPLRGCRINSVR